MFAVPEHTVLSVSARPQSGIATLLRQATTEAQRWRHQLRWRPDRPVHLSLPVTDAGVRVWLTGWPPGVQATHVYPGQGAFTVLSGSVVEDSSRPLTAGRIRVFGPGYRHLLSNPTEEPAITVHVELSPTRACADVVTDAA
jgi:hypothetical protein